MVSAKELRIGNFVNYRKQALCVVKSVGDVLTTQPLEPRYSLMGENTHCKEYHPVPITKEVLEKCGFESNKNHSVYRKGFYYVSDVDGIRFFVNEHKYPVNVQPIHYVHQLQNVYYALTGHELEISLQ